MATVLITGATTGLGRATAVTLARGGHDVYATMRDPARSPELQTIARKESLPISILRLDVDRDDSVMQAVGRVLAERGQTSMCSSTMRAPLHSSGAAIDARAQEWMHRQRDLAIGGRITMGAHGCYTATKCALEALSEALAQEDSDLRRDARISSRVAVSA